jgi:ribosome-interacting GTPase 1
MKDLKAWLAKYKSQTESVQTKMLRELKAGLEGEGAAGAVLIFAEVWKNGVISALTQERGDGDGWRNPFE